MNQRDFDIIAYGATGYTGQLVAEYLNRLYGEGSNIRWALGGRSQAKLEAVRDDLGLPQDTPLVVADTSDPASVQAMAKRTKVVLTTVGPYQLYGSDLVAACAEHGTGYVDLCGEPAWMHEMIAAHNETAKANGARIVFSCGFDSIPFDLGVYFLQQEAKRTLGKTVSRVKGRVRAMEGTFSGGTQASFTATMAAAAANRELYGILANPFALTEGFQGPEQPRGDKPEYDEALGSWATEFVMASINTKNVHRSNFLLGLPYGEDFVYDEMLLTGDGEQGEMIAKHVAEQESMSGKKLEPGEGPSREEREAGHYDALFVGETPDGQTVRASVQGDMDPGYGSTSKMMVESAVCLVENWDNIMAGISTPAAAFGEPLIKRLQDNAGLTFQVEG